jgi:cell division septum initiation protein DivIVA
MTEQSHLSADLGHDDQFKVEMRGYNRREVDETVAALRLSVRSMEDGKRDLEERLSQALDELERLRLELSAARSAGKPAHEEISERIGQILKLADDEAKSQRTRAEDEITKLRSDAQAETTKLRSDAKAETDRSRAEAHEQAERMLSAAQEQADSTVSVAKADAENTRKSAATDAQQVVADATKQAETALASAKSQAKQQLDEATARATAIHDGAERRLNLLMSRHTEAIRRLTEIRDVVTTLVAGEADRGSLEDEVARAVAGAVNNDAHGASRPAGNGRPGGPAEGRHVSAAGGQQDGQPALSTAHRPSQPGAPAQHNQGNNQARQAAASQHGGQADNRQPAQVASGAGAAGSGSAGPGSAGSGSAGPGSAGTGSAGTGSAGTGSPAGTGAAAGGSAASTPANNGAADSDDTAGGMKAVGE